MLNISLTKVMTLNITNKVIEEKEVFAFIKSNSKSKVLKIKTQNGFELKVTGNHKILTRTGMRKASELERGTEIAVYPFSGVRYNNPSNKVIVDEEGLRSLGLSEEGIEVLKDRGLLPLREDNKALPIIAKILGYMLGDGYLNNDGVFRVYGKLGDMLELREDFLAVGFKSFVKMRDRNYRIKTHYGEYRFRSKIAELGLHALSLSKLFIALGMPTGKKTVNDFGVPRWVREAPKFIKRLFLAGFFGAEMSSPSTLSKTGFYSPIISQNKNERYVESCRKFFAQIIDMLGDFDIKATKISVRKEHINKFGDTYRIRLLLSADEENLLKLWGG